MIKDKVFKALIIPLLGFMIPLASGLLTYHQLGLVQFIASIAFFIFISHIIWQGAVKIFSYLRSYKYLADNIFIKLFSVSSATTLYGVIVVFFSSVFWQLIVVRKITIPPITEAAIITSIAVFILTLIYECVFLSAEAELNAKVLKQIDNERLQAEINVLQNELEPHFLFNCLNTLSYLVRNDGDKAYQFIHKLSNVFKYLLINKQKDFVSLAEEIEFLEDYYFLLQVRFDDGIQIQNAINTPQAEARILPCTLQVLVENAIKHNFFSDKEPLFISIQMNGLYITVSNPVKPKLHIADSTKIGLNNLRSRYRLIMNRDIAVDVTTNRFSVSVPVVKSSR